MIPLLEAGLKVEGYDSSLGVCRQRCSERGLEPVVFGAEMTSYVAAEPYCVVIVPTGSITLLAGRQALSDALAAFRQCLAPGERLFIDVPPPDLVNGPEPMRTWAQGPSVWTMHVEYDAVENATTRWLRYEKWTDGTLDATELHIVRLQHWTIDEFADLQHRAGITDIAISADYSQGGPPDSESKTWTFASVRA